MKNERVLLITAVFLILNVLSAAGQSAQSIVAEADSVFTADRVYSESIMTVYINGRAKSEQLMEGYSMDEDGKSYSLTIYKSPARMKGTAYLMADNDLWVRFSTTGRIRKMSSSAKKNSAGGSDFSYADMGDGSSGIAEKYNVSLIGTEEIDGTACYKIEMLPAVGKDAPYEKIVSYITEDSYRYLRIEYYDSGANIKTMTLSEYRTVGEIDYPFLIEMKNNTKDSRTVIETELIEFDSDKVSEHMFSTSYLERIR